MTRKKLNSCEAIQMVKLENAEQSWKNLMNRKRFSRPLTKYTCNENRNYYHWYMLLQTESIRIWGRDAIFELVGPLFSQRAPSVFDSRRVRAFLTPPRSPAGGCRGEGGLGPPLYPLIRVYCISIRNRFNWRVVSLTFCRGRNYNFFLL